MLRIASTSNAIVKRFRELARRARSPHVLLDGEHLLEEALQSGVRIDVVAFSDRTPADRLNGLAERARRSGAALFSVSEKVMSAMSPVRQPSGIVAIAERRDASLEQALGRAPQLVPILIDVQDPGNVGAIIRAADACGATGVVAAGHTADPFAWKALRGSMGSAFHIPVASQVELDDAVGEARKRGIRVLATAPRGGTPLPRATLRTPAAILLGGEGGGLPAAVLADADELITIPMKSAVESLNVSIAAALIVYEASRQRS